MSANMTRGNLWCYSRAKSKKNNNIVRIWWNFSIFFVEKFAKKKFLKELDLIWYQTKIIIECNNCSLSLSVLQVFFNIFFFHRCCCCCCCCIFNFFAKNNWKNKKKIWFHEILSKFLKKNIKKKITNFVQDVQCVANSYWMRMY